MRPSPARPGVLDVLATIATVLGTVVGTLPRPAPGVPADGARPGPAGGETTVFDATAQAFSLPARNLQDQHRSAFFVGNSFFNKNWIAAPASVADRDGLGPLFNARSCSGCHLRDGRGRPPASGEPAVSLLVRISVPGSEPDQAPRPDPGYGDQIQTSALPGVPAEAEVRLDWQVVQGAYEDGQSYQLRRPRLVYVRRGYGAFAPGQLASARVAPAMVGLGLLESVPESRLLALADPDDRDGDGISGRPNWVPDRSHGQRRVGRFGWKAEQPSVLQQAAAAFVGDMGITSSLFPQENHTRRQGGCARRPTGGTPEISDAILHQVATYVRLLGVPARRQAPGGDRGEALFRSAGCARCHVPQLKTGEVTDLPELAGQTIWPYTDLLLHDMGGDLADQRPVFAAGGREWRTPPLWGLGLIETVNGHQFLLHDGRARGHAEAILWHGGEAKQAREAFRRMSRDDRQALVSFLETL
jgi:CxxC motif-containing protein (DUF1111 family)